LSYRFSHELVRRALYDRLSALRRARLHLRVGEALERVHLAAPERVLPELAHHFTIAAALGADGRVVDYNVRAAEAAVALFAFAQAERFASTAVEHADEGSALWAKALYLLATAEHYLGRDGSDVHAAAAAAAFAAHGDVEAAAEAHILGAHSL